MILISYDIESDKLRTKFSKYLSKFGYRIQYSVFRIDNSQHILNNIIADIENEFSKKFGQTDSVYIIKLNPNCEIKTYGYAKNDDRELTVI